MAEFVDYWSLKWNCIPSPQQCNPPVSHFFQLSNNLWHWTLPFPIFLFLWVVFFSPDCWCYAVHFPLVWIQYQWLQLISYWMSGLHCTLIAGILENHMLVQFEGILWNHYNKKRKQKQKRENNEKKHVIKMD